MCFGEFKLKIDSDHRKLIVGSMMDAYKLKQVIRVLHTCEYDIIKIDFSHFYIEYRYSIREISRES